MVSNPLISVIVPIYKVEDYLDECVQSIVGQTYRNLEIILVDDGSPDRCPQMCDDWARRDPRIRVVHKPNGGLSDARNAGLDVATGEYIGFVDSDDYIAPEMYQELLKGFDGRDDLAYVAGEIISVRDGVESVYRTDWHRVKPHLVGPDDFAIGVINNLNSITAWNKLYRSKHIRNTRFRKGRNNEDTLFLFELSKVIERDRLSILELPVNVYYYRTRAESISTSSKKPLHIDVLLNQQDMMEYYRSRNDERWRQVQKAYNRRLISFCLQMPKNSLWMEMYFKKYHPQLKEVKNSEILSSKASTNFKLSFLAIKYMPKFYCLVKKHLL